MPNLDTQCVCVSSTIFQLVIVLPEYLEVLDWSGNEALTLATLRACHMSLFCVLISFSRVFSGRWVIAWIFNFEARVSAWVSFTLLQVADLVDGP